MKLSGPQSERDNLWNGRLFEHRRKDLTQEKDAEKQVIMSFFHLTGLLLEHYLINT